jgi:hypothetical protein
MTIPWDSAGVACNTREMVRYDKARLERRTQLEIDWALVHGEPKDWMKVLGYLRAGEGLHKRYFLRRVAVNPRVDMAAGTVQLVLADGSRVLELNKRQAQRLLGLLQSFLFPKEPDPRQRELVKNVNGAEVPNEEVP